MTVVNNCYAWCCHYSTRGSTGIVRPIFLHSRTLHTAHTYSTRHHSSSMSANSSETATSTWKTQKTGCLWGCKNVHKASVYRRQQQALHQTGHTTRWLLLVVACTLLSLSLHNSVHHEATINYSLNSRCSTTLHSHKCLFTILYIWSRSLGFTSRKCDVFFTPYILLATLSFHRLLLILVTIHWC